MRTVRPEVTERRAEAVPVRAPGQRLGVTPAHAMALRLQRTAGNAATAGFLQRGLEHRNRSGAADLRDASRGREAYVEGQNSALAEHAGRAGIAENVGSGIGDAGAAGLLTAAPTTNTRREDTKSDEDGAGLWMAAGAGDVVAGPAAFIGSLAAFRDKHASFDDRVNAVFGMSSSVTQTVGGGATFVNNAYVRAGQVEDEKLKKAGKVGDAGKSSQTKIGSEAEWNAPAFVQDFVSALKGSIEMVLKFADVHASRKNKEDSKATTSRLFFEASASFLSAVKSLVSGARYLLKFFESGAADALTAFAIPGVGLAVNAAHLVVKVYNAVKAAAKRAAMKFIRSQLLEKVLRSDATLDRRTKNKQAKQSAEEKHTWRDRLRGAAAAGGSAAATINEYLLADLMQRLAKKRFVRAMTTMVPKVAGMLGDILTLSGIGAIGGTAAKAFGSAWEVGQTGFRWFKQKIHDRKPEHHKSTVSKQREYVAASDAIFDQYAALPSRAKRAMDGTVEKNPEGKIVRDPWFELLQASAETYVKAAGARPSELYQAKDIPDAYRVLIKAMKGR